MVVPITTETTQVMPDVAVVQQTIEQPFPGLWPAVDLGLPVCASVLLADNVNPVAVIYVGAPSSSKTTVADMFADHPLTYISDNFTPAAFVSHAANVSRKDLEEVDLLPRIKHKVLITPEMAPIFRGKEDELATRFAILTRVLDGQGLQTDSGTHGQRGYRGDYLFAWLGCTTPFEGKVWRVMAQLGSRLFFLVMDSQEEVTIEDLVDSDSEVPYKEWLTHCKDAVRQFLTRLFQEKGVCGVPWRSTQDPRSTREWIARCAKVLASMRSEPGKDGEWGATEYTPARQEQPRRAYAVLRNIARGHALVHGRLQLSHEDLPLVAQVTNSTMPGECARILTGLVQHKELTVAQVQEILRVRHPDTARRMMKSVDGRGVMEFSEDGAGKAASIRFRPDWEWCTSPEFRAMLLG